MQGIPLDFQDGQTPPENRLYDSAARLLPRSPELEACTAAPEHYLECAAVEELPDDTEVWTFAPSTGISGTSTSRWRVCTPCETCSAAGTS